MAYLDCDYVEVGEPAYPGLVGDGESELASFHVIRNVANEIYYFSRLSRLPGQPAPYDQLLIQPLLLCQNAISHKILNLGFLNF